MEKGQFTRKEIFSQPEAWTDALNILEANRHGILALSPEHHFDQILFTGCGSTYYLAMATAAQCQQLTGKVCRAFPASELWLNPNSSYADRKTLLVAISRSGETTETLKACQSFLEEQRGTLLTLSCYDQMPLARMGTLNIILPSGQEQSVAQTRAFSTLYLSSLALTFLWAGRTDLFTSLFNLPEAGRRVIDLADPVASDIGSDASIDRFYWLGSGACYGLAAELSLKMKEMSLTHSEPFHFLEFRHGPKSMVTSSTCIIGLQSLVNAKHESAVLADMQTLGGRVVELGQAGGLDRYASGLDEISRSVLYIPVGQLIAYYRSQFKGLDPDLPNNLDAVVKLSGGA
jgi:glucosamine--fructose-6-phosphate aminotransferase (isomerizing)